MGMRNLETGLCVVSHWLSGRNVSWKLKSMVLIVEVCSKFMLHNA